MCEIVHACVCFGPLCETEAVCWAVNPPRAARCQHCQIEWNRACIFKILFPFVHLQCDYEMAFACRNETEHANVSDLQVSVTTDLSV